MNRETPLPSISRDVEPEDMERYQTIFAKNEGAVAAPTAGLHFPRHLLKRLEIKGLSCQIFHVGLGTFNPVRLRIYQNTKWIVKKLSFPRLLQLL